MLRKLLAYLPVLSLVLCLFSVRALAGDECSSTNSTAKNSMAQNVPGACANGRETRNTTVAAPKGQRATQDALAHPLACTPTTCGCTGNPFGLSGFSMLFNFTTAATQGEQAQSGILVQDSSCNLYGTTYRGGAHSNRGAVYEVSPETGGSCPSGSNTGNGACETLVHSFSSSEGFYPRAPLFQDPSSNLWGQTGSGGANSAGIVFELTPSSGGSWTYTTYPFPAYTGTTPVRIWLCVHSQPIGRFLWRVAE